MVQIWTRKSEVIFRSDLYKEVNVIRPTGLLLLSFLSILAAGGASCPRRQITGPPLRPAFNGMPTTDDVIREINKNSNGIQRLRARGASFKTPDFPSSLRTELLALERPHRFRLRADTAFSGVELDLGSNDEMFWIWIKRAEPRAVYFCRHEQFHTSAAQQLLSVEPQWLMSALGVMQIDRQGRHYGPHQHISGRLEFRSLLPSPGGELTRVLVLDDQHGWILEQHLYNSEQRLLASSYASQHRQDPTSGVTLPHHVDIQLPPTGMSFSINVDHYEVNQDAAGQEHMWRMPEPEGYTLTDLAEPGLRISAPAPPPVNSAAFTRPRQLPVKAAPRSARLRPGRLLQGFLWQR